MKSSITFYSSLIKNYPVLTAEQEQDLFARIKKHNLQKDRDTIVLSNLRFAIAMAGESRFQNRGLSRDELIQESLSGLIKAIDKYDLRENTRFLTYAKKWMFKAIMDAIYDTGDMIRLPQSQIGKTERIAVASLDAPAGTSTTEEDACTIGSFVSDLRDAPDVQAEKKEFAKSLYTVLEQLPKLERDVVTKAAGLAGDKAQSFAAIGREYNYTREHTRQIYLRGIKKFMSAENTRMFDGLAA